MKLGSVYPRGYIEPRLNIPPVYVGPRLIIPGGILEGGGGMLDLLHRGLNHCAHSPLYCIHFFGNEGAQKMNIRVPNKHFPEFWDQNTRFYS